MIAYCKMHGLGNSFIFFDEMNSEFTSLRKPETLKLLCDPRTGIGADGVIFLMPPRDPKHQCRMQMFNTDGTEAEMCGNAVRCVAHLFSKRQLGADQILIETSSGVKAVGLVNNAGGESFYRAQMGQALFDLVASGEQLPADRYKPLVWNERTFEPVYVNVGNPHAVIFMKSPLSSDEMKTAGAWLETHPNHPRRINIEFVEVINRKEARINIWERGCGMTQACGTGATATVAAGIKLGHFDKQVTVHMPGGDLVIEQDAQGCMFMTGPVQAICTGQIAPSLSWKLNRP
ncbi:MAG TPA: diaminopimelate epimerase [Candidatus Rifleibacterium sp.]|nr:diaminopimelate epimerase [Candidatus Rifleibacterium sp.]HPT48518.1 diaminopimelate epimerase [Candidatus Rifleibacterium sp.]